MDFTIIGSIVRPGRPHIWFLFVRSWLCSTLPSDPASRRRPCVSLALHHHQVRQGLPPPSCCACSAHPKKARSWRAKDHSAHRGASATYNAVHAAIQTLFSLVAGRVSAANTGPAHSSIRPHGIAHKISRSTPASRRAVRRSSPARCCGSRETRASKLQMASQLPGGATQTPQWL
jgi:hypothetical protein